MDWVKGNLWFPLGATIACSVLSACSQGPDMSGIAAERERQVRRYDISQSVATNGKFVVVGTQSGAVLISGDQGKSWKRTTLGNTSLVDITVCGEQGFVAVDHYHKVWSADAEGKNWQSAELKDPQTPIAVTCDKRGGWWVVGTNSTIAGSKDQGKTWLVTELGADAQLTTIQFPDEKHAIAMGEFGLIVMSDDGGVTWKKGQKIQGDFYPYASLFKNANEGWASGIAGQILATKDGGKTWSKQANATQAAMYRLFLHEGVPFGVGATGIMAHLDKDIWRNVAYTDALPVFLGGGASLPGQPAVVIGGPGGLLRAVGTVNKQ